MFNMNNTDPERKVHVYINNLYVKLTSLNHISINFYHVIGVNLIVQLCIHLDFNQDKLWKWSYAKLNHSTGELSLQLKFSLKIKITIFKNYTTVMPYKFKLFLFFALVIGRDLHGRDRMVIGLTTTYTNSAYHH